MRRRDTDECTQRLNLDENVLQDSKIGVSDGVEKSEVDDIMDKEMFKDNDGLMKDVRSQDYELPYPGVVSADIEEDQYLTSGPYYSKADINNTKVIKEGKGEKPYKCYTCEKAFKKSYKMY